MEEIEVRLRGPAPAADGDLLPARPPNISSTMAMQYRSAWREGVEDGWNEARAVLARWGRPAVEPVPVSERLPGPEDCGISAGGYFRSSCWCWHPPSSLGGIGWWSIEPLEWCEGATHWLPAHALPLPPLPEVE